VDAGRERLVEVADPVRGEEEDARVVLENAKEDLEVSELEIGFTRRKEEEVDRPDTKPFRMKSCGVRAARKTSASSRRRMHPHLLASAKCVSRADSTSLAVVPRSPRIRRCPSV